jgi:cob(I)alamin adenosyltransferase
MKIYTRTGDHGQTSLFGGARVPKNDPRIDAYGTVDELSSHIGVARATTLPPETDTILHQVQVDLFEVGAHLASPGTSRFPGVDEARIAELEQAIDTMERELQPLTTFILPAGTTSAAHLHVARTVCRRAERLVVALEDETPATLSTIAYLNRLSDYLFVAARYANLRAGVEDVPWKRTSR